MPCKADEASASPESGSVARSAMADGTQIEPVWVASDGHLAEAVDGFGRVVGLDTEFQRTDTFFPLPGLYQIAAAQQVYLVDPLAVQDFAPLLEVLEDRRVTKIMHACSEDLELLRHHFGAVPVGLFDTQLANAFVSPDYSISFTRLVQERLGLTLVQHETRSDWLARPLSSDQLRYACEDVYYLPPLHAALSAELERLGRMDWFREEMDLRGRFALPDPDDYYLSVKKAWRLSGAVLARLQALTAWRERQAMADDRPRNRVVRDEHLLTLAQRDSVSREDLRELLPRGVQRRYGDDVLAAHARGTAEAAHPPAAARPLGAAASNRVRHLRDLASREAAALGMAPELLGRKREIEACVRHFEDTGRLSDAYLGWRWPLLGERMLAYLEETA